MSVDNLSISFASSIGIENIKEEYLNKNNANNLYTDLDQLEKSVEAEFEQYMNQAWSFPFHEDSGGEQVTREHPQLKDTSVHSDYEILGASLLDQVNDDLDLDDESWRRYLENTDVDDKYNVKPLRNHTNSSLRRENEGGYTDNQHYGDSRNTSPGEYFGARSLPLNSIENVWQQREQQENFQSLEGDDFSYSSSHNTKEKKVKTATEELLETRFKTLPRSLGLFPRYELPEIELHHPYTQKQNNNHSVASAISSTRQQCASRKQRQQNCNTSTRNSSHCVHSPSSNNISHNSSSSQRQRNYSHTDDSEEQQQQINGHCTIDSSSPLHFLCEISPKTIYAKIVHLKITNSSPNSVRSFSLFSSKNMLEFEVNEGMILEHEVVDIKIKIQSSALLSYRRQQTPLDEYPSLYDKVLVLIDHQHVTELDVNIDFISLEDDNEDEKEQENVPQNGRPKCRYCALEKGYPLHCL